MAQRNTSAAYGLCYVAILPLLQSVARDHGYALAVHGSMHTDLDLIAAPWIDEASDAKTLAEAIRVAVNGQEREQFPNPARKPHLRKAWSFYLDDKNSPYIDISILPRVQDLYPELCQRIKEIQQQSDEWMCKALKV